MDFIYGDAQLSESHSDWYVMLPLRIESDTPTVCDGEPTFIGVDLGIVRIATVSTPDGVGFFDGKAMRQRREHGADLRKRHQRHNRLDKVKAMKGKESDGMGDMNHKLSRQMVDLAAVYANPVIVFERLDGIRHRTQGSQRFNRMMGSWTFRHLTDFVRYKAEKAGILIVFVDPRGTSKTCTRCGHGSPSNRPDPSHVRCIACGYRLNADLDAARNIAALGPGALEQGPPDMARTSVQTGKMTSRPDALPVDTDSLCQQTATSGS